jgi:hypothetical protein
MTWEKIRNFHQGDTCIVVGNGPSLNDIPLSFLNEYPSFGTNRIYLLNGFSPWYYVATNPLVLSQFLPEIKAMDCIKKFVPDNWEHAIPGSLGMHMRGGRYFSIEGKRIHEGYTVTYVCLQLAYYMGFTRVLLVGVDHSYQYAGHPNEEYVLEGDDPNHFTPEYFTGCAWNNPDLRESELSYTLALLAFNDAGREIINCSTKTQLLVFPRGDWRDYV